MEKGWINSMLSNVGLEYKCRLSKSMDNWGPLENTDGSQSPIFNDTDKNTDSSSYSNVDHLIGVKNIRDFGADDTFLVMYSSRDNYSIYFDIEKLVFEITNQVFLLFPSQFFSCFSSYSNSPSLPNGSRSDEDISLSNTKWNNYINSCIDSYFRSQISIDSSDSENFTESENKNISGICIDSYSLTDSENFTESENEIDSYILTDSENFTESENEICCLSISTNDLERPKDYSHLWVQCDDCYDLNYKKYFKSKMNICEHCGYHLEMTSSDRIELLIDPDTWVPMDEDMQCIDPIEFDSDFELGWDEFESDCGEFESDSSEFEFDCGEVESDSSEFEFDCGEVESDSSEVESDSSEFEFDCGEVESDSSEVESDSSDSDWDELDSDFELGWDEFAYKYGLVWVDSDWEESDSDSEEFGFNLYCQLKSEFGLGSYCFESDSESDSELESGFDFQFDYELYFLLHSQFDYQSNSEFESEFEYESYYDLYCELSDYEFESEFDYEFDYESDSPSELYCEVEYGSDSQFDYESDYESDSQFDYESDYESDSQFDYESDYESDSQFDYESDYESDSESDSEFDYESDSQFDYEFDSESDSQFDYEFDSESDSDSDSEFLWDEVDSEEEEDEDEPYIDRFYSYQEETGLTEAVQTGTGQLNGITLAMGVMDFRFIGGSMGSAVGEKITRLIEYAAKNSLPLILVCASGGARMQEGSLSLMQMAKISSALYDYQVTKKLFFVSILTSPTTGGVTASFGMLGDIIIAEPNATIAFAGKRVIEQTLNIEVPEGVQETEFLFDKGLFDLIVPRNLLKGVLNELFHLHALTH